MRVPLLLLIVWLAILLVLGIDIAAASLERNH